jgi:hypothetical protein
MSALVIVVYWEVVALVVAFAGIIAAGLLSGTINTSGLLEADTDRGSTEPSPERVQLLAMTIGAGFIYLRQTFHLLNIDIHTNHYAIAILPDIPTTWIILLSGSNALYLARKYWLFNFSKGDTPK